MAQLEKAEVDRQGTEKALTEIEGRCRAILDGSPAGIHMYRLEPNGRLIFEDGNPAADWLLGVDNSQFIGKTIEEAFPPLAETEVPEAYRLAASEGRAWDTENIEYEDEQIKGAFEVRAFHTGPGRMSAMFLDITARKRAEEELKQRESHLRAIFEAATEVALITTEATGMAPRITEFSPGAEHIFDYHREEVLGKSITTLLLPEDASTVPSMIESLRRRGEAFTGEWTLVRKSGEEFTALLTMHPMFDAENRLGSLLMVCLDIEGRPQRTTT
jgi:PAS domain S-box-containing protein